ncbi:MAG: BlaB/IND/MUS family subclass B1 metallo-beta-lactamase [Bacteroidetes bacterium]|nr:BlaB/IND/MUS family subclass B1 metallo-beta-lactamase [Bacteroidota bacterium]
MKKLKLTIFFSMVFACVFGQNATPKLVITPLKGDFYIYTTYNNYKGTLFPSNGMYLITDAGAVIIDSPWDTTQFQPLLDSIKARHGKDAIMCLATHSHEDRTAALEYYQSKGIKTYTTKQTDEISKQRNEKRAAYIIENDMVFSVGQYKFQTYYGGSGHTPDNIVVWFENEKVLYGGCLVKSTEAETLGNLADADTAAWPKSIKQIQKKFKSPKYIIPGHQSWKSRKSLKHTLSLIKRYQKQEK